MFHVFLMDVCGEDGNMKMFHVSSWMCVEKMEIWKWKKLDVFFFFFGWEKDDIIENVIYINLLL